MNHTAALTIRTDPKTKRQIADFAASVGLSTSAFATAILLQAVRDRRVILSPEPTPTPYLKKLIREAESDLKTGKNIKTINNAAELDDFFESL